MWENGEVKVAQQDLSGEDPLQVSGTMDTNTTTTMTMTTKIDNVSSSPPLHIPSWGHVTDAYSPEDSNDKLHDMH
jgi:hypothetical protein